MRYLFFDIECADGARSTICAFGYVIADLSFNIIEQRDILINPESEFNLTGRAGRPDLVLAYPEEDFLKAPTFDKVYDEIKALLEDPDFYIVGHAIENDVKYINMSCKRYGMPPIEFEYFDTQRTWGILNKQERPISLANAIVGSGVENEFVYHRSDEDARATMLVLKSLLEKSKLDFEQYSANAYHCTGRTYDFYWGWNIQSLSQFEDAYRQRFTKDFLKEIREGEENRILRNTANYRNLLRYVENGAPIGEKSDLLAGKTVSVSLHYEAEHYKEMLTLVGMIKAAGGTYTREVEKTTLFATYNIDKSGATADDCARTKAVKLAAEQGTEVELIELSELLELLGTSFSALTASPLIEEDYFLFPREI